MGHKESKHVNGYGVGNTAKRDNVVVISLQKSKSASRQNGKKNKHHYDEFGLHLLILKAKILNIA